MFRIASIALVVATALVLNLIPSVYAEPTPEQAQQILAQEEARLTQEAEVRKAVEERIFQKTAETARGMLRAEEERLAKKELEGAREILKQEEERVKAEEVALLERAQKILREEEERLRDPKPAKPQRRRQ